MTDLGLELRRLPAPLPIWHAQLDRAAWSAAASKLAEQGARLVSMWGIDRGAAAACAAYATPDGLVWLELAIADGPVHAGIIEPGHFRFSVVGEKVLRLEEHLGYVHKGIERRFTELPPLEAHRLAGRVSGDSTVAYAWAYCMALESAWQSDIP